MEAHADLQSRGVGVRTVLRPSGQVPLQAQGRQHGALRMIFLRHRRAKDE
jgi:hypothetical protein